MAQQVTLDLLINSAGFARSIGEAKTEIAALNKALQDPANAASFDKLEKALGKSKGQFKDLRNEINLLDPDKKAQAFVNLGQSIAGAFAVGTGAIGLFGEKSALVEEAQKRAQSAIALLQGIQALANAKDDLAAVKKILGFKGQTAAIKETAAATEGLAVAEETASVGAKILKVALASIGIGLLIAGITFLIENFGKIKQKIVELVPGLANIGAVITTLREKFFALGAATVSVFKDIATVIGDVFTFNFSKAIDDASNIAANAKKAFNEEDKRQELKTAQEKADALLQIEIDKNKRIISERKEAGDDTFKLEKKTLEDELTLLKHSGEDKKKEIADKQSEIVVLINTHNKELADKQKTANEKKAKDDEDAAKKELELQKQLLDSKIAQITDDAAREEATLINQFNEKLALITGQSATEIALRESLEKELQLKLKQLHEKTNSDNADSDFTDSLNVVKQVGEAKQNELKKLLADGKISQEQFNKESASATAENLTAQKNVYEHYGKDVTEIDGQILDAKIANNKTELDEEAKKIEAKKQLQRDFLDAAVQVANGLLQAFQEAAQRRADAEIAQIQRTRDAQLQSLDEQNNTARESDQRLIDAKELSQAAADRRDKQRQSVLAAEQKRINDKAAKEEAQIKTEAFKKDKAAKIIEATIAAALAVAKASPVVPLMVAAGILGATQIALIASQPVPKFARGGRVRGAGTETSDSIPAWLSDGEYIVNAKSTRAFLPLLEAINERPPLKFAEGGKVGSVSVNNDVNVLNDMKELLQSLAQSDRRVFVVETDITRGQNRVNVVETRATIG